MSREYAFIKHDLSVEYEFVDSQMDVTRFMKMHGASSAMPASTYAEYEHLRQEEARKRLLLPVFNMCLFHGRKTADEHLDDWGFEGPEFTGIIAIYMTYLTHIRIKFRDAESFNTAMEQTGWEATDDLTLEVPIVNDLVKTKDGFFGDWSFYSPDVE